MQSFTFLGSYFRDLFASMNWKKGKSAQLSFIFVQQHQCNKTSPIKNICHRWNYNKDFLGKVKPVFNVL